MKACISRKRAHERVSVKQKPKPFNDLWTCPAPVELGKRDRRDRYRTSEGAVSILLQHVNINGTVLDMCGSTRDNVYIAFANRGPVTTNDINVR